MLAGFDGASSEESIIPSMSKVDLTYRVLVGKARDEQGHVHTCPSPQSQLGNYIRTGHTDKRLEVCTSE